MIQKAKVYVKNPGDVPQGAKLQRGGRGGMFYESEEQERFTQEVSGFRQKVMSEMKFSDAEKSEAEDFVNKHLSIARNEFIRVSQSIHGNISYRVKDKYSVMEKARRKNYKISDERDVLGMRIGVNNVQDIYDSVERLEQIYGDRIIEKEDYIQSPKGLYRAYHMNIKYADGIYGEIQIRTLLMDRIANASHFLLYKNTKDDDEVTRRNIEETLAKYSCIAVGECAVEELNMTSKVGEMLEVFGL